MLFLGVKLVVGSSAAYECVGVGVLIFYIAYIQIYTS